MGVLVTLLAAFACRRRGEEPPPRDAGFAPTRSMDLRTGLILIFPEWRGAQVVAAESRLSRTVTPLPSGWVSSSEKTLQTHQFAASLDGGVLSATRPPFVFVSHAQGEVLVQEVSVVLTADDVTRIYQSPAPLSSEQMALWLPTFSSSGYSERFALSVHYRAPPTRASFLTRQLVDLSTRGLWQVKSLPEGWQPPRLDGGFGAVPERFELILEEKDSGATMNVKRDGEDVWVRYVLPTR